MNYIKVLEDIISIDTSVPPGLNYGEIIDYLQPMFADVGFATRKIYIPEEYTEGREVRVNLICHRREQGKPRLIFYAHIDVVPAEGWNAFHPRVENGKFMVEGQRI